VPVRFTDDMAFKISLRSYRDHESIQHKVTILDP
jgi:hypothetical protein